MSVKIAIQNTTVNYHFYLLNRMLKICGIYFDENEKLSYKIYSGIVLSLTTLYPLFQLIGAFKYLDNGLEIFEFTVFEFTIILIIIKISVIMYNRKLIGGLLYELQTGSCLPNFARGGIVEEKLVKRCIKITNIQAKGYWILVLLIVTFAIMDSIYSRISSDDYHDWKFEYGKVTVINTTYSPNYEISLFYQNMTWYPVGLTFAVCDLLTCTVLAHITCQFKMLQNAIRRIVPNSYRYMMMEKYKIDPATTAVTLNNKIDTSKIPWKYIHQVLKETIHYHLKIINIANKLEATFNMLVLLIVLSGIILMGSLLYRLTIVHVGGVSTFLCEIFLICYWGNEVSLESQKILQACYDADFVGTDVRFQKALCIMMERSKKPIIFTAGKFSPLTLGTFLWIAKTTYSYLMILRRTAT